MRPLALLALCLGCQDIDEVGAPTLFEASVEDVTSLDRVTHPIPDSAPDPDADVQATRDAGADAQTARDAGTDVPSGARVRALSVEPPTITEGQRVTFTALITGEGPARLRDAEGIDYGDIGANGLELEWAEIHAAAPIEFTEGEALRVFVAHLGDSEDRATLRLACDLGAACDGHCVSILEDARHCGGCGRPCDQLCLLGMCRGPTECIAVGVGQGDTCNTKPVKCATLR